MPAHSRITLSRMSYQAGCRALTGLRNWSSPNPNFGISLVMMFTATARVSPARVSPAEALSATEAFSTAETLL